MGNQISTWTELLVLNWGKQLAMCTILTTSASWLSGVVCVHSLRKFRRQNKLHEQVIESQFQTSNPLELYPICLYTCMDLWKIPFMAKEFLKILILLFIRLSIINWHIIDLRFLMNGSREGKLYPQERFKNTYLIGFPNGKIISSMK